MKQLLIPLIILFLLSCRQENTERTTHFGQAKTTYMQSGKIVLKEPLTLTPPSPERIRTILPIPPPPIEEIIEEEIIEFPAIEASFPGGDLAMEEYIVKNLNYPQIAKEMNIQGKVYVEYMVERDGQIMNVRVIRGVDRSLDREAVRVVKKMPRWNAAEERGRKVIHKDTIILNFVLR